MPAAEPIQAGPYPEPSDAPDGPNQLAALAVWAAGRLVMRFASPAARDAAITSPVEGMEAFTGSALTGTKWSYWNGDWRNVTDIPRTAFTPTWNGVTLGNGTTEVFAARQGRMVDVWGRLVLGSTSSVTATISMVLPFVATNGMGFADAMAPLGVAFFRDASNPTVRIPGVVSLLTADETSVFFTAVQVTSYATPTTVNAAMPFTWAVGDILSFNARYEAAV